MAAHDPATRRAAASTAARARLNGLTPEQRRAMTQPARHAMRLRDLAAVDHEARLLGQYPLAAATRNFRADLRRAVRAKAASDAQVRARARDRATRQSFEAAEAQAAHHEHAAGTAAAAQSPAPTGGHR